MRKLFTLAMAAIAVSAMFASCTDDKTEPSDPKTDTSTESDDPKTDTSPIVEQGTTGDLTWTLSEQGTLRISGTGDIPDYAPMATHHLGALSRKRLKMSLLPTG